MFSLCSVKFCHYIHLTYFLHCSTVHMDRYFFQLIANQGNKQERENAPYIAAKFPQRNIPYTFHIGNGEVIEGFTNRKLERGKKYRIFVRAVVDTPQKVRYKQYGSLQSNLTCLIIISVTLYALKLSQCVYIVK
jgi:hypothetical protein